MSKYSTSKNSNRRKLTREISKSKIVKSIERSTTTKKRRKIR
jgi:hypothetical protein